MIEMQNRKPWLKVNQILAAAVVLLFGFGIAHYASSSQTASPTLHGDSAHPAKAQGWVDTQLYFGLGPADAVDKGTSEAAWRDFLDKEVTPRFPDGLSVMDVYGQWQGKDEKAENAAKIDAIRTAWKQKTGEHSVLKVSQPADVSF
jgi:hypothetical protein